MPDIHNYFKGTPHSKVKMIFLEASDWPQCKARMFYKVQCAAHVTAQHEV